jgi:hypothetical protein
MLNLKHLKDKLFFFSGGGGITSVLDAEWDISSKLKPDGDTQHILI